MPPIDVEEMSAQLGAEIAAGMDGNGSAPVDPGTATPDGSSASFSTDPAPAAAPPPAADPAPEPQPWDAPPQTWGKLDAEKWKGVDSEIRQLAHKREQDFHRGLEMYRGSHQFRQTVDKIFEPHIDALRQAGMSVDQVVPDVLQWYAAISSSDANTRAQLFSQLADNFGLKIQVDQPYVDPQTQKIERELAEIKGTLSARQQADQREQMQVAERAVDAFLADAKNEFIRDPDVAKLTIQYLNSGVSNDIADAYDKAVWAVPTVRAKLLEREAEQKLQKEVQRGKEAARRNAPDSSGSAPSAVDTAKSLDQALAENLRQLRSS